MDKLSVCISFDYSEDRHYRYLLKAWDANSKFEFYISDKTPDEIDSSDYSRVKAVLTTRIKSAEILLVIVGKKTNTKHPRSDEIGFKNWQIWEIQKAKELKKKIVAVKIERYYDSPHELLDCGAKWAMSFTQEAILVNLEKC